MPQLKLHSGIQRVLQALGDLLDMMALDQFKQRLTEGATALRGLLRHAMPHHAPVASTPRVFRDRPS